MNDNLKLVLTVLGTLLAGGAMGALITEWFRRRRSKTQAIPLIERVNRNPVSYELRGIKLFRLPIREGDPPAEVKNIREYQLTLRNTSDRDLRGAEIQFEFSTADVDAWVSRASRSNAALTKMQALPAEPWKSALRWSIPQFPPGDSIEFTFQVVDPSEDKYAVALYNADNLILNRTTGEPPPSSPSFISHMGIATVVGFITVVIASFSWSYLTRLNFDNTHKKAPEADDISKAAKEAESAKYQRILANPGSVSAESLSLWVPVSRGGDAIKHISESAAKLVQSGVHYGAESRLLEMDIYNVVVAGDSAVVSAQETWDLPVYGANGRLEGCRSLRKFFNELYLRKIDGKWLVASDNGPPILLEECLPNPPGRRNSP